MEDISVNSAKALLFDLGGVVIDIDLDNIFIHWAKYSNCSVEEIKSKFSFDLFYESRECGEINSSEYFNSLKEVYNSFDIGKRKPEHEAFRIVSELIGVKFNEIVFYDDSVENIAAAYKLGMNTVHVKSIFDVENSLNNIF